MAGVERLTEGVPGEVAEVWVQDRGGGKPRLRGTVVIEDLTGVLTAISAPSGANGPLNPVTQFILAKAADHLAERLADNAVSGDRESVPRILSSSLGHQPFIEQVLGMSPHQIIRRWPLASDWYTDVINYVMRPSRFDPLHRATVEQIGAWASGSFGNFLKTFGATVTRGTLPEHVVRVAEALQSLWPDYAPVRRALDGYQRQVRELWLPLYLEALTHYGLTVREGVDPEDLAWAINALQARETLENLGKPEAELVGDGGERWSRATRGVLFILVGTLTDLEGRMLSHDELLTRMPVADAAPTSQPTQ